MKTLGLIGGTSWVSTADYYRYLNQGVNERLGGNAFATCIIHSLNFGEVIALQEAGDEEGVFDLLLHAAEGLERAGAQGLILCANTMHRHAGALQDRISVPIIHVVHAVAKAIHAQELRTVALLGTKATMELGFYKDLLAESGIATLIPEERDRAFIHRSIFAELGREIFLPETKARYQGIIASLVGQGAQGTILGCTEIPLLIKPGDVATPTFDTTLIHARAAVEFALG